MKSLIQISAAALLVGMTGACAQEATTDTETADMATTDMAIENAVLPNEQLVALVNHLLYEYVFRLLCC